MARIRTIKPSFFASESVSLLPMRTRLTWIGLWTHCDDEGRCQDNVKLIKAALWPLDDVSLKDVESDLNTLADRRKITRYEVDGRRYLQIRRWHDHQRINRPSPSHIPAPPVVVTDDSVSPHPRNKEGEGNKEGSSAPAGASGDSERNTPADSRGCRLPEDWQPTTADVAWCRGEGHSDTWARKHTEAFRDYWRAQPGAKGRKAGAKGWSLTWRNWIRREAEKQPQRINGTAPNTARLPSHQPLTANVAQIDAGIAAETAHVLRAVGDV